MTPPSHLHAADPPPPPPTYLRTHSLTYVHQLHLGVLIGWRRAHRRTSSEGDRAARHSTSADLGHLAAELTTAGLKSVGSLLGGHQNVGAMASRLRESSRGSKGGEMEVELNPPNKASSQWVSQGVSRGGGRPGVVGPF